MSRVIVSVAFVTSVKPLMSAIRMIACSAMADPFAATDGGRDDQDGAFSERRNRRLSIAHPVGCFDAPPCRRPA
jgi:hypothetical protein